MSASKPKLLALPKRNKRTLTRKNLPTEEALLARRQKAFDMRAEGAHLDTIARELGVSVPVIHDDLKIIRKLKYQGLIEKDEHLLLEQNNYLDKLLEKWLPLALAEELKVGHDKTLRSGAVVHIETPDWESGSEAAQMVLKIMENKAKINGLIGNTPKDKSPEEIGTSVALNVIESFRRLVQNKPLQAEVVDSQVV